MKNKKEILDLDQLKRWKYSSPESKLTWLAAALEFGKVKKRVFKRR